MYYRRIAHRGFSSQAPENSRGAFALAVEGEFFGVECDIWRALDGTYVVSHDGSLKRMCGVERYIPDMTYEEIRTYPLKKGKKRKRYPTQYLIRFSEYLSIMARSSHIHPIVELKMNYTVVELREIVSMLREYGLYERTYLISLHRQVLLSLREELEFPAERLQYVYGAEAVNKEIPVDEDLEKWLIENRVSLDARYTLVTPQTAERLHKAGLTVNVWTVNDRMETKRLLREVGVDMITTEYFFEIP